MSCLPWNGPRAENAPTRTSVTRASRRLFSAGAMLIALAGIAVGAYFMNDSRAKDRAKGAGKGAGAVPVVGIGAEVRSLPVRMNGIGNAEAVATVATKARVDGQIV